MDYVPMTGPLPGTIFEPSNGTEGVEFFDTWCSNCAKDEELNGTAYREGRDADEDKLCPIVAASLRGEAVEWREMEDGSTKCAAFVPVGRDVAAQPCKHTLDLFADGFSPISDLVELPDGTVMHKDDVPA